MSRIHLLENSLINKIAAGEVVERPSSVVKELLENSIDAGATVITIEIKDGGTTQIRITDNGHGISKEDLKTAFLLHATSKIKNLDDLENVLTLGFRGEALSTICAVSQMETITKTRDSLSGSRIEIHGGQVISEQDIGAADGTTVIVRNLFYNTPARRKFLKKASTEGGYISDIINKIAIGHPELSIKYINNSSVILQTNGNNDLKTVLLNVYGKDVATKLLPLEYNKNDFQLSGLIGKPEISRSNRAYENFFLNGRFIKSELLQSATEEAYKTKLLVGKFPIFVLNLTTDPNNVDVNVHPTKLEVRFSDEDKIYNYVYESISNTLKESSSIPIVQVPQKKFPIQHSELKQDEINLVYESPIKKPITTVESTPVLKEIVTNKVDNMHKIADPKQEMENLFKDRDDKTPSIEQVGQNEKKQFFFKNYKIVGQLFHTYWIIEQNNSVYLIDQHALHERELYEKLLTKIKQEEIVSQRLVEPQIVKLSESEKDVLHSNIEIIQKFGFEIEESFNNEVFIKSVPCIFNNPVNSDFFIEIIGNLQTEKGTMENIYETKLDIIASKSCKAAVKANDKLSHVEVTALIENALKLENPFNCPHGRPTIIELTKYELEKIFKR